MLTRKIASINTSIVVAVRGVGGVAKSSSGVTKTASSSETTGSTKSASGRVTEA
jgi:hypothetical protein